MIWLVLDAFSRVFVSSSRILHPAPTDLPVNRNQELDITKKPGYLAATRL